MTALLLLALLPQRPSYALKAGETYRYRYEERHDEREPLRVGVTIEIAKVSRNGNADLLVTVLPEKPTEGFPRPADRIAVDRWLYRTSKREHSETIWEPLLRIEKPGLRKGATYEMVPGDDGRAVYEIREPSANALVTGWRKTMLLDAKGLPISAETRSDFEGGSFISHTLIREPASPGK